MPRRCTICDHEQREAIDQELVRGASLRDIAGRYRVSKSALERHKANHLPATLAKAKQAQEVARADSLINEMRELQQITMRILDEAGKSGDHLVALRAVGEARRNLELLGKLLGELDTRPQFNILLSPQWITIRAVLLNALQPFPEARQAVAKALLEVDGARSD